LSGKVNEGVLSKPKMALMQFRCNRWSTSGMLIISKWEEQLLSHSFLQCKI